ncbi:unnamed protein product [Caretta caretta]
MGPMLLLLTLVRPRLGALESKGFQSSASQRRVTFHLPDGSQESCSDSGLGDHEPVGSGTLISHPLPLVQPQDEFYDQASPDKRTEADGNSDPNSDGPLGPRGLAEATEMCTQECLVLGHSDNCWMPPSLGPYQQPKSPLSTFAPQKEWVKKDKLVNGHTLTRTWKEDSNRNQFSDRKQYGSGILAVTLLRKETVRPLLLVIMQRDSAGKLLDLLQSLPIWKELHTKSLVRTYNENYCSIMQEESADLVKWGHPEDKLPLEVVN